MDPINSSPDKGDSLLLELAVPFRVVDGHVLVETQAYNGLSKWLDNFQRVTVCAPVVPESMVDGSMTWRAIGELQASRPLVVETLPWGYHPKDHFRHAAAVSTLFDRLIPQHRYLVFSNLGWLGAWGNVAAARAYALGRPYAVWLDWVLHEMPRERNRGVLRNLWESLSHFMLKQRSLRAIKRAALGLFHGRTVYEAYAPCARHAEVVHDVHLSPEDVIAESDLQTRLARSGSEVEIVYVGRVHPMKGPNHWTDAVAMAASKKPPGVKLHATWYGGGPMLEACREQVAARGLSDLIRFAGPENDRSAVLSALRSADLFVFCHLTPESPRCLIEALMSGLPIVGFDSPYARDLVEREGGGVFVGVENTSALSDAIVKIVADHPQGVALSKMAQASGRLYSDVAVFEHRSHLVKAHLR